MRTQGNKIAPKTHNFPKVDLIDIKVSESPDKELKKVIVKMMKRSKKMYITS